MKSNEALLVARQNLIREFKKYEYIILPLLRFIITFSALRMLIAATNYTGTLNSLLPTLCIALIGTFIPAQWILMGSILLSTLFIFSTNPILAIVVFVLFSMLYLIFMRLFPKESLLILVVLIAFSIHMELIVPIIAALFGSYICIVSIIIGVILWFIMPQFASLIQSTSMNKSEILDVITSVSQINFKQLLLDEQMLAYIVIFFVVFSAIYFIRKQSIDYAAYIAIGVGAAMNIVGFLMATLFFSSISENIVSIIIWTLVYSVIAVALQFLSVVLDYQRAEVVAFEDDDNYYYVKVIPKIHMNTVNNTIKHVYTTNPQNKKYSEPKGYSVNQGYTEPNDLFEQEDYTSIIMEKNDKNMNI